MNLLITENGQIIGQTMDCENAKRHAIVSLDNVFAVCKQSDIDSLPAPAQLALYDQFNVSTPAGLWRALKKKRFPYWGKVSVQAVIRRLFTDNDEGFSREQLIDAVPGASWVSITTALSMLKNPRYAKGPVLKIERTENDVYKRIS